MLSTIHHAGGTPAQTPRSHARPVLGRMPAHRENARTSRRARGFTIVELCVTLAIVTCVAATSIWAYFSRAEVTLQNAAQLFVDDLHMAQARASYMHTQLEFVFLPNGEGYYVTDSADSLLPSERSPRRYTADAIFEGVEFIDRRIANGTRLVFDANGHANSDASFTLGFAGHSRTIALQKRDSIAFLVDAIR